MVFYFKLSIKKLATRVSKCLVVLPPPLLHLIANDMTGLKVHDNTDNDIKKDHAENNHANVHIQRFSVLCNLIPAVAFAAVIFTALSFLCQIFRLCTKAPELPRLLLLSDQIIYLQSFLPKLTGRQEPCPSTGREVRIHPWKHLK